MITAVLCLLSGILGVAIGVYLAERARPCEPVPPPPAPAPVSVPVAPVAAVPRQAPGTVQVRLMSGSGRRELGRLTVPQHQRPHQITYRGKDGLLAQFLASQREGGVWTYRRVGVVRESK